MNFDEIDNTIIGIYEGDEQTVRVVWYPPMPFLRHDGGRPVQNVAFKQWDIPKEAYNHIRHQAKQETYHFLAHAVAKKPGPEHLAKDFSDYIDFLWHRYQDTHKEK